MNKIFRKIFIFLCLFVVMFVYEKVNAISITSESTGIYFTFMKDNGHRFSDEMMIYKVDGKIAYCIEPGVSLGSSNYYLSNLDYLDNNTKKKIEDYMYYGYMFDRQERDFYIATQALIWETLLPGRKVTFSTQLFEKGNIIDMTFYKNQIITGVNVMNNNFETNNTYEVFIGDDLLIDNIQLNNRYDLSYDKDIFDITLRSQSIKISNIKNVGTYEINLTEKDKYTSPYLVYRNDDKQDLLVLGNINHKNKKLIINVVGGGLNLLKEDHDTFEVLPDAKYGIYNKDDELLYELITNEDGKANIDNTLLMGEYYLKEIEAPIGYELDDNSYYFTIDKNNRYINMIVDDFIIEGNLIINKYDKDTNEVISDTSFNIYDDNENIIETITTDNKGTASIRLKYGKYHFKEVKANDKYELDDTLYDIDIYNSIDYIKEVYNTKIPEEDELIIPDVPNTNKYSYVPFILIGVIIVKKEIYYYILNH